MARLRRNGVSPWPDEEALVLELMATFDMTEEEAWFWLSIT